MAVKFVINEDERGNSTSNLRSSENGFKLLEPVEFVNVNLAQ